MSEMREVTILLVEDDPGHARLIEKNLRRSNITNDLVSSPMDSRQLTTCPARAHTPSPSVRRGC